MLIVNVIVLLLLDFYIFFALKATKIKFAKTKTFGILWWGYSILLSLGVIISFKFNIPLLVRSVFLVAFFLTAASKFFFFFVLILDDLRRGGLWLTRLLTPKKTIKQAVNVLEMPISEEPVKGITRSDFLTKAGILVGASPLVPLSWGII